MKQKHEKYLGKIENINMLILVAIVFDLHSKFKFVEWSFGKLHDFIKVGI